MSIDLLLFVVGFGVAALALASHRADRQERRGRRAGPRAYASGVRVKRGKRTNALGFGQPPAPASTALASGVTAAGLGALWASALSASEDQNHLKSSADSTGGWDRHGSTGGPSETNAGFDDGDHFHEGPSINPATGLPMMGMVDIDGNPYGSDLSMASGDLDSLNGLAPFSTGHSSLEPLGDSWESSSSSFDDTFNSSSSSFDDSFSSSSGSMFDD